MFAVIDCGSTNTRVYLVKENLVIGKGEVKAGVNDTAITGSKQKLKNGISEAFELAVSSAAVKLEDIQFAIASGMITSDLGLMEIPHLVAPVSVQDLSDNVQIVENPEIFPFNMPVVFVPGIKNNAGESIWDNVRKIDLMRGEETQAIGLVAKLSPQLPVTIIELGSTTKLIHIDKDGRIAGSITTLSGQVYNAVKKETFIGNCVKVQEGHTEDFFSLEVLKQAYDCVQNAGLLRSLLFTRFIQFSLPTTAEERKFYCESAIAADDMKIFAEAESQGFHLDGDIIFVGNKHRSRIYETMMREVMGLTNPMTHVTGSEEIDMLAVIGASYVVEKSSKVNQLLQATV